MPLIFIFIFIFLFIFFPLPQNFLLHQASSTNRALD
jgi:hypothetical protein